MCCCSSIFLSLPSLTAVLSSTNVKMSTGYGPRFARLCFDGDEQKYELWEVKFLAHLRLQKLATCILPEEDGGIAEAELDDDKNADAYAELVQVLDDRSLSLIIRDAQGNGRKALALLREHYISTGKPRVISLYTELTSLKLSGDERVTDYMIKAETAASALKTAGENVSDSLLVAMVIKGLPAEYKPFTTVVTQKDKAISFSEFKVSLRSYEETMKCCDTRSDSSVMYQRSNSDAGRAIKCYKCGKPGHKSNDPVCPQFSKRAEKRDRWCSFCRTNTHNTEQCRKRNGQNQSSGNRDTAKSVQSERGADSDDHTFAFKISCTERDDHEHVYDVSNDSINSLLVDCGATTHIVNDRAKFVEFDESFEPAKHYIELADGSQLNNLAQGKGTACVQLCDSNGELHDCMLKNALYVPSFKKNIFSVQSATDLGSCVKFSYGSGELTSNGTKFNIVKQGRLYYLNTVSSSKVAAHTLQEWHNIMGHCNYRDVLNMEPHVNGMKITDDAQIECEVCVKGKMTQNRSRKPDERAKSVFDLVHCDLAGPIKQVAKEGFRYALVFVDDYSGGTVTYFLQQKSDTVKATKKYLADIAPYGKVKCIRSDNGGEFMSNEYQELLVQNQIMHQTSAPYSPHQNGTAERAWRTLFEMARCMLIESGLPKFMWAYAVMNATFTRNRCFNPRIGKTSFEAMTGRKPDVSNMHVFGTKCYAYVQNAKKLDARCAEGIFVGYDKHSPAYLVYVPDTQAVKRVRCVTFTKSVGVPNPCVPGNHVSQPLSHDYDDEDDVVVSKRNANDANPDYANNDDANHDANNDVNDDNGQVRYPRRANRGVPPVRLHDYDVQNHVDLNCSVDFYYNLIDNVPNSYTEAVACDQTLAWKHAMNDEISSLHENHTWDLTPLPEGRTPVGGKWVYAVKHGPNDDVKFKARFVAKGYSQQADIDYHETFSPTARMTSIRMLQQISVDFGLSVHQMDVKSAYLNAEIDCEIFVEQPEGYEVFDKNGDKLYCRLNKSLYGLKQSGRNWNHLLHSHLVDEGFTQSLSDPCLYTRHDGDVIMIVIVWVDDIIIGCNDDAIRDNFKQRLSQLFKMKDLGEISHFIGIQFIRYDDSDCVKMCQSLFIEKVLQKFRMSDCKPRSTPCEMSSNKTSEGSDTEPADGTMYRSLVGSLIYIMVATRPDLSYVVTKLSQHMSNPTMMDFVMAKHVVRYLKGTMDHGIVFTKSAEPLKLTGFCDSDWGGSNDRRSISGYCFGLTDNNPIISWKSKKQQTVALSSCEAEYVAICAAVQEGKFLVQLLKDMIPKFDPDETVRFDLMCDNQGAIALAKNPVKHQRSKHIDIKYHFIRNEVQNGKLSLMYVPTADNIADVFTKSVSRVRLNKFSLCSRH